ncbi:hypothetical protein HPG27_1331 [Helicobacter pylori G27]|uniref:Uncharacterized protein n=1 Tax=Helicobacter pylori (strain G27) TaxID=563041 RepID=B5Z930_HELPG|nr:hypothetical protein HPG27_1331 [Helicobacter pylori G27]
MPRNVVRKFYSLKSYRFITKIFSLIVKNAFSVLDFYSFILLVLLFISFVSFVSFVFNFFSWGCYGVCI